MEEQSGLTVQLAPDVVEALTEIQRARGNASVVEALRNSISNELYLVRQTQAGGKLLIETGSNLKEVSLP